LEMMPEGQVLCTDTMTVRWQSGGGRWSVLRRGRDRGASDGSKDEDGGDKYARSTTMASGTTLVVYPMAPATDHNGVSRTKSTVNPV
jgi:hypothetical protein